MKKHDLILTGLLTLCLILMLSNLGQKQPPGSIVDVQVNPPQEVVKQADVVKKITQKVIIPKDPKPTKVPVQITIVDPNTGEESQGNGEATITPNDDGTTTVEIPTTVTVTLPDKDWKFIYNGSPGIGYEILEYGRLNLDGIATTADVGLGVSYDITKSTSLGIEESVTYSGKLKTSIYIGISL